MMVEGGGEELAAEVGGEELAAEFGGAWVRFGEPILDFGRVGAPGRSSWRGGRSEADEDGGVEESIRRRIRALGEVEDEVETGAVRGGRRRSAMACSETPELCVTREAERVRGGRRRVVRGREPRCVAVKREAMRDDREAE
ncbi:hypothetical protein Syun_025184 [Stephania yunnanensis]|uniref:Uncharacterized protein n=1 Tax=Stephania yunnanensis TaxID=152371 RepID=A0AAP0F005_9MAGN